MDDSIAIQLISRLDDIVHELHTANLLAANEQMVHTIEVAIATGQKEEAYADAVAVQTRLEQQVFERLGLLGDG